MVKQKEGDVLRKRQKCKRKIIMDLEKELKEERNEEERGESERNKQEECGKEGEMGRLPLLLFFSSLDR